MRVFVFLLILANLLFLAWTQGYLGNASNPDAFRIQNQLLADQVKVVSRDEPPEVTSPPTKSNKAEDSNAADTCLLLSDVSIAEIAQIETLLTEKLPAFKSERTAITGGSSYWVNIPPLANQKEVDAKVAELKKLNITEFYVVQEAGPNIRAISLGLYSTQASAKARLDALVKKGVKSAKIVERITKPASASIEIRGPEAQADALRQAIAETMPERKLAVCKTPAATSQ